MAQVSWESIQEIERIRILTIQSWLWPVVQACGWSLWIYCEICRWCGVQKGRNSIQWGISSWNGWITISRSKRNYTLQVIVGKCKLDHNIGKIWHHLCSKHIIQVLHGNKGRTSESIVKGFWLPEEFTKGKILIDPSDPPVHQWSQRTKIGRNFTQMPLTTFKDIIAL